MQEIILQKKKKNFITFCFHNWNHITCFCYLEQNIATNLYVKLYLNLCCRINSRNSKNRRRIETSFFTTSSQDKSRWKILLKEDIFDQFMWRHHCLLGANFERVEYFPPKARMFIRILGVASIKTAFRGMKCLFLFSEMK